MKIRDMRKALDNKDISVKELTNEYLSKINNLNNKIESFITVTDDLAVNQADKAQDIINEGDSKALTGIPIAIKDNICTEGVKTTCASKVLENLFLLIMQR